MATLTISAPKGYAEAKKRFPHVNWNEVIKQGILERLKEIKKFEELRKSGRLIEDLAKVEELRRKGKL